MGALVNFGIGAQRLLDSYQAYMAAGPVVSYRYRNFPTDPQTTVAGQFGYIVTNNVNGGTTDVIVTPQPSVNMVSLHNIGMSMGRLRFGARQFLVSATFVNNMQSFFTLANSDLVWRGEQFVGLVCNNQLFSVEDIVHEELAGYTISYVLTANSNELK